MVLPSSPIIMISMCIDSKVRNNEQNMPYLASLSKEQQQQKILLSNEKNFSVKIVKGSHLSPTSFCQCTHTPPHSGFCTSPSASRVAFLSLYLLTHSTYGVAQKTSALQSRRCSSPLCGSAGRSWQAAYPI